MTRKAFTLIELLVVIAIIAILAAILFPVFAQAKVAAKKAASISNVKQIATAHLIYNADYDDLFCPVVEDNPLSEGAAGVDYLGSWMFKLEPYTKNKGIFYSPASGRTREVNLNAASNKSGDIIFQYAMLPRWQMWNSAPAGSGSRPRWLTGYGDALMDGIGGYQFVPGTGYWGNSNFCGQGGNQNLKKVDSMSQTAIARVSETALVMDARGFEYGMTCNSPIGPSPDDASANFGAAFVGISFEGRYNFEGTRTFFGNVPYRQGVGTVSFADGSAKALKTPKFFETIVLGNGQRAYRYQYSQE